jgi:hypothetical protein
MQVLLGHKKSFPWEPNHHPIAHPGSGRRDLHDASDTQALIFKLEQFHV